MRKKFGLVNYGDVVGPADAETNLYGAPDGFVNVTDIQAVKLALEGAANAPHLSAADIDAVVPNWIINGSDVQLLTFAMQGLTYPFAAPSACEGAAAPPPAGDPTLFTIIPDAEFIDQEPVSVEVFVDSVNDLGAYEVTLEVSGGSTGQLQLASITVEEQRQDFAFSGLAVYKAINLSEGRVSVVLTSGAEDVTGPAYLATFVYQPVGGAYGAFNIAVKNDVNRSFLNDCDAVKLAIDPGDTEVIGVGIDCFDVSDCAPMTCKVAACTNNECAYTNASSGMPCNDGQYCTLTDLCDGNGVCIGSGSACTPPASQCCELTDECIRPTETCPPPN